MSRSKLIHLAATSGSSTIIYKEVSSAKSLILHPTSVTMSFIKIKKRRGPKIDSCGTPALIEFQSDVAPGMTTRCFLSER